MTRAVGVDLGATNARAALVEVESGKILAETKQPWTDRAPATVACTTARGGQGALQHFRPIASWCNHQRNRSRMNGFAFAPRLARALSSMACVASLVDVETEALPDAALLLIAL